jgi:hypothetical protein
MLLKRWIVKHSGVKKVQNCNFLKKERRCLKQSSDFIYLIRHFRSRKEKQQQGFDPKSPSTAAND